MAPKNKEGGVLPNANSALTTAINQKWGSYEKLIEAFNATTVAVQGNNFKYSKINPQIISILYQQFFNFLSRKQNEFSYELLRNYIDCLIFNFLHY